MTVPLKQVLVSIFILLGTTPLQVYAYEPATHAEMSAKAFDSSVFSSSDLIKVLGISANDVFDLVRADPNPPKLNTGTARGWVREGTVSEDDNTRPLNHFFDPTSETGLQFGVYLGNPSPNWALELDQNRTPLTLSDQNFSYRDTRDYFYRALTARSEDERSRNFGKTFEGLGRVAHHLQDMAQPQHVRNDMHCDSVACAFLGVFNPSLYEIYTNEHRGEIPLQAQPILFGRLRDFWTNVGQTGLAQFVNRNFVSAGSNFVVREGRPSPEARYALPEPILTSDDPIDVQNLFAEIGLPGPKDTTGSPLHGDIVFVASRVDGELNRRASTYSLFDQDLRRYQTFAVYPGADIVTTERLFTLNRFNFDAAYPFLTPRAVAYSAGLINYFFRGRLEATDVEFTNTGVRLRVKNAVDAQQSPAWSNEVLYAANSSGQRGVFVLAYDYKGATGTKQYGTSPPVVAKTAAEGGGDLAPGAASIASYDFALSIPGNAREVHYRIVFRGRLGQEEDAVAVGLVQPVSGFIVTPNYLPHDGIAGPRNIHNEKGTWVLSQETDLRAGNIDWKGWFVGGVPTRVVTWMGPTTRYFPDGLGDRFAAEIFQHGQVYSVAPLPVLGAAINRDTNGKEWLVAICRDGLGDVVYRRPNRKSESPALFDAVANPDGWQQIGFLPPQPLAESAQAPWLFNGTGTEAQTMRAAGAIWHRYKVTIGEGSAQFESFDEPQQIERKELQSNTGTRQEIFAGYEKVKRTIAVDYKDQVPVFGYLTLSVYDRTVVTFNYSNESKPCNPALNVPYELEENIQLDSAYRRDRVDKIELSVGTKLVTLRSRSEYEGKNWSASSHLEGTAVHPGFECDLSHVTASFTTNALADGGASLGRESIDSVVLFADLRSEVVAVLDTVDKDEDVATWKEAYVGANSVTQKYFECGSFTSIGSNITFDGPYTSSEGARTIFGQYRTNARDRLFESEHIRERIFPHSLNSVSMPIVCSFDFVGNSSSTSTLEVPTPRVQTTGGQGSWVTDLSGNFLLISQEFGIEPLVYLDGGTLQTIIPFGSFASRYYPAFVIK
jgi:hypothetical protein